MRHTANDPTGRFHAVATPCAEKAWEVYDRETGETVFTCNTRELAYAVAAKRNRAEKTA